VLVFRLACFEAISHACCMLHVWIRAQLNAMRRTSVGGQRMRAPGRTETGLAARGRASGGMGWPGDVLGRLG
jgi:hypothetical protein